MKGKIVRSGLICLSLLGFLVLAACAGSMAQNVRGNGDPSEAAGELALPELAPADLGNSKLRVAATTSIIGDVVAQVGGEAIELKTLMGPGQDPHSYEPSAGDLTAVADAHVIFVNGWDLEEGLLRNLRAVAGQTPLIPVSAGITPLVAAEEHDDDAEIGEHDHEGADPHVWFDPHNVQQWVVNIEQVLSALDPANAAVYQRNAAAYQEQLNQLIAYADSQLGTIPAERRKLVTNHNTLGYFAARYQFEVIGTVLPAASTLAEPSASALADLTGKMAAENICTLFAENTANARLAQTVSAELTDCPKVQVITLYTGAIGPAGSGADSYIGMMRANIDAIVGGLK